MTLAANTRLGRYEIRSLAGVGGMGEVYLAYDASLDRTVALKILPAAVASDKHRMRRFVQEAKASSALNHPNILTVYEIGHEDLTHYIATEFIDGTTLRQHMTCSPRQATPDGSFAAGATMSVGQVLDVAMQAASALAAAHAAGVVHRDIKPENIMIRHDGIVKVLDFGLAKLTEIEPTVSEAPTILNTEPGVVMGTVGYMSPEQVRGLPVDARTDIWSLGVVLYEMLAGRTPFAGQTTSDVIASVLEREPPPLTSPSGEIPAELDWILKKLLHKDREERYQTVKDLLGDLKRLKQRLEFESELERSTPPGSSKVTAAVAQRDFESAPTPPVATTAATAAATAHPQRKLLFALGAILAVSLALAGYLFRERLFRGATQETSAERITLAVLPFHTLRAPEEVRFLGLGIPDAIITRLANVQQIRLRPTSAILRYENQKVDLQQAGRELKSDYVVTGTLLKDGERFRVSVQMVRTSDGTPLWGERYDKARADLLNIQDSIAEQIASALQIKMTATERERVYRRYTDNVAAYELYLRGRSELARYTKEGTLAAVKAFEGALQLDPNYALAHAGLAMASTQMSIRFAPETEFKNWGERAKAEAGRALELDPKLAEAHEARAAVYRNTEFDWDQTIEESRRALELNPNLEQPHYYRAAAFYHLGLLESIDGEVRAGMEINPANRVEPLRVRGNTALFSGKFAEAASLLEEARRLSEAPVADWYLAHAYYYQGERARAEKMLTNLRGGAQAEQRAKATLASFLAARGEKAQAEALLGEVSEHSYTDHHVAYGVGTAYAQLGNHAQARQWLAHAAETGLPCYPWYAQDPLLQPLRNDAEFQSFLARLQQSWASAKARHAP